MYNVKLNDFKFRIQMNTVEQVMHGPAILTWVTSCYHWFNSVVSWPLIADKLLHLLGG